MIIVFQSQHPTRDELERAWRDRLARNLRAFRRIKGRWPYKGCVPAVKRAIEQAVAAGCVPPVEH
jgi:hypothetical protein